MNDQTVVDTSLPPAQPMRTENQHLLDILKQNQGARDRTAVLLDPTRTHDLLADHGFESTREIWKRIKDADDPRKIDVRGKNSFFVGCVDTLAAYKTAKEQREASVATGVAEGFNLLATEIQSAKVSLLEPVPGNVLVYGYFRQFEQGNPELAAVFHNIPRLIVTQLTEADNIAKSKSPELTPKIHKHKLEVLAATMGLAEATVRDVLAGKGIQEENIGKSVNVTLGHIIDLFKEEGQKEAVDRLAAQKATQLRVESRQSPTQGSTPFKVFTP